MMKNNLFWSFVVAGYLMGTIWGYLYLETQPPKRVYECADYDGVPRYDPDDPGICLEWSKDEYFYISRGREAFYTWGLLGAFIGGWIGVLYKTYIRTD